MELIETSPELANEILLKGGKIVDNNLNPVKWINLNNMTCYISRSKISGYTANIEDIKLNIKRNSNKKKLFTNNKI